jgi:hypothetical protein
MGLVDAASFNGKQALVYEEAFLREWYWQFDAGLRAAKRLHMRPEHFHIDDHCWLFGVLYAAIEQCLVFNVEVVMWFAREYGGPYDEDIRSILLSEGDDHIPRAIDDLAWAVVELARRRKAARKACETADYILSEPVFPGEKVEKETWRGRRR